MSQALQRVVPRPLDGFSHATYVLIRPLFSWYRVYRVHAPTGELVAFVEQPWFRIRPELVMYADEAKLRPILVVKSRRFAALNMEHDLFDANSGQRLGVIRTQGWRSLWRDSWDILDGDERPAGRMMEDEGWFWRRVFRFLPGRHHIELGGRVVARISQVFHFFRREFVLEILPDEDAIEPRFAIACALIAMMADLRREESN
jgi:uncharacterized protein YxjI